jgi:hypothetical protein
MKLYLTIAAFACDVVGTILVVVDAILAGRRKAKLEAVQDHITRLEIQAHETEKMPPALSRRDHKRRAGGPDRRHFEGQWRGRDRSEQKSAP